MEKQIIVIGAGASGIATATRLIFAGFKNVLLLEAENRIGGRVNTIPFGQNVIDLGAQWCHGEKDNVVFGLAQNKNLLSSNVPRYTTFELIRSNGMKIPMPISDKLTSLAFKILEEDEHGKTRFTGSLGNYFAEKYREALKLSEYSDVDDELKQQYFDWFHKMENSIEASNSWYETSCRSYPQYWICDGDHLLNWKDHGYATVLDLLQKRIPLSESSIDIKSHTKFNKKVSKVKYDVKTDSGPVRVSCDDGSVFFADHVICTVSLGVLKECHLNLFEPHLPIVKQNSIDGMSIGVVDKIFIEFDKPFWTDRWEGFNMLWRPEELQAIRDDKKFDWLEDIFGFFTQNFQPNILCGWITGPNAKRMEELSDEDVTIGVVRLLKLFLKQWNIPNPKRIVRSKWYSNENFRGSYTYYSMKSDALEASTSCLAEPVYNSARKLIIQFAGEATHEHYYSTVHGAIESGWREAKRLIDFYKLKSQL